VVWIKIGGRTCSDARGCSNTGRCASAGNRRKYAACCQPGGKRFSRDACCGRSARRAYPGSVRRDAGARTGSFCTGDASGSHTRAGYAAREAGGEGIGYSALEPHRAAGWSASTWWQLGWGWQVHEAHSFPPHLLPNLAMTADFALSHVNVRWGSMHE
jgi:hypothetical protein